MRYCSLQLKILLTLVGLLALLGGTVSLFIRLHLAKGLREELEKRGVSIAKHIAQSSVEAILSRNPLSLAIAAANQKKTEEDIVYIFFLGPRPGEVLGHTFGDGFPARLLEINPLSPGEEYAIRHLETEAGRVYDIAVPVTGGGLGQVRLGISARSVEEALDRMTGESLAITFLAVLAAILLAVPLSAAIVHPVRHLTRAAERAAEGHLDQEVPAGSGDEIGQLAFSFNRMLLKVQKAQEALLVGNRELAAEVERRQQAEKRLAAQLSFLGTLLDALPSPVFFKGTDGRYAGCNRAFEEFAGRDREAIVGLTVFDLFREEEAERHARMDRDLFAVRGICSYEGPLTRADGMTRQVIFHKATFRDESGKTAGLVGIFLDVTSDREIDRLRNEFISTAAHEFQTPLAAILGFSELLLNHPETPPDERQEYLGIVQEKAGYLSRIVDQLLDVARLEAGRGFPLDPKPCRADRLILNYLRSCQQNAPGHHVEVKLPSECPAVIADEDRIVQVLDNLLSNAVKYSPKGSLIRVVGEATEDSFRISVEDQGPGLDSEHLERIFDKFYRAHTAETSPSGTGLGLYIARSIVEAHGGTIRAESEPGAGTRITFSLPLAVAAAA